MGEIIVKREGRSGDERRDTLIHLLKNSNEPLKAAFLAEVTGVSRQVIVQDMALLRASEEPIFATPQGYLYMADHLAQGFQTVICSNHTPIDTEQELNILVDHGVNVLDVGVDHSVYGRIFRPLNIKSRLDVRRFLTQMTQNDANLLSSLTGGLHFHTLEAPSKEILNEACHALAKEGFLVRSKEVYN